MSSFIDIESLRRIMGTMGSQALSAAELDAFVAQLKPDAEGRVSFDAFRSLDCWIVPLAQDGPSAARKQRTRTGLSVPPGGESSG